MIIRNLRGIGSLYFLALLVAGCATQAQIQFQQMQHQATQASASANTCYESVKASEVGQRVKQILVLDENDPSKFKKMLINRAASEREKQELIDYQAMVQPCRTQIIEGYSRVHPLFVNLWAKIFSENDEMLLKLIKEEVTVGELNTWSAKVEPLRRQAFTEASMEITQQLQSTHAFELQQRAAASQALQRWAYQQQLLQQNQQVINSLNRPTYSNCQFIGNNVHCTSY